MRILAALIITLLNAAAAAAAGPLEVEIAVGEGIVRATLYRPDGAGPFPAVVALHSCGGLAGPSGAIAKRYSDWGERLSEAGFVVLFPDSYATRGLSSQCDTRNRVVRTARERVVDAHATRLWLQHQDFVIGDRVSLLGWANGGAAALWAVRRGTAPARTDGRDFRSAVALYPGCRRLGETAWSARVPTLLLLGSADDWAPTAFCEQMVAGARGRSARARIIVYAGAHHDFDQPGLALAQLAYTADGSRRAHVGTDPAARTDAFRRVPEWLRR